MGEGEKKKYLKARTDIVERNTKGAKNGKDR